jgi:3-oxoadipate enol-lactonase
VTDLIAHDVAGSGSAVLLLHSGVANRQMWQPQWQALTASHRVVRCDLRGFGETPVPTSGWSNADDVLAVLDALGVAGAAVVGSSYGGRVALELATVAPARVSRLVLLCPAYDAPSTPDVERFGAQEDALLEAGDVEGAVALNVRTWLGPDASAGVRESLAGWQRQAFELQLGAPDDLGPARPTVDAATVDVATTVVTGAHDLEHFRGIARHLTDVMPRARLVELPWAGHLPSLERPDDITELLLAELAD